MIESCIYQILKKIIMLNLYEERVQFNVCHSLLDMSGAHLSRLNVPKTMVSTLQKNFFLHFD